jgi:hypothetical protein
LDGSFELTTSFEVNYTYLWGSNRYGYASTTQDGIKVSGEALQFLTDPTNPNSELVTIDAVNKPYYFDKHLSSFDTIAGLEDALNAGTYGFAMSEVVLYKGKPIIQQIDNSTFVIALYNTSSKFKNTEVITSDLGSKEFIYFAKINVYNLLSDPTVINDKFAAKSFAYLDEGTLLYTDKQGRI